MLFQMKNTNKIRENEKKTAEKAERNNFKI